MTYTHATYDRGFDFARPRSRHERIARLNALATLLDTALVIPGINVRFGLDALIGLVPGIGDVITTLLSLYIVHEARQLGAPRHLLVRMMGNVALDGIVGAVPLVGDAFDVMWRSNRRNMRLLQNWLDRDERRQALLTPSRLRPAWVIRHPFAPERRTLLIGIGGTPDFSAIARSCSSMIARAGASPSRPPSAVLGTLRLDRCEPSS